MPENQSRQVIAQRTSVEGQNTTGLRSKWLPSQQYCMDLEQNFFISPLILRLKSRDKIQKGSSIQNVSALSTKIAWETTIFSLSLPKINYVRVHEPKWRLNVRRYILIVENSIIFLNFSSCIWNASLINSSSGSLSFQLLNSPHPPTLQRTGYRIILSKILSVLL